MPVPASCPRLRAAITGLRRALPVILALIALLALAACDALRGVELPTNSGAGSDKMKPSPCACADLDYRGPGYQWEGRPS